MQILNLTDLGVAVVNVIQHATRDTPQKYFRKSARHDRRAAYWQKEWSEARTPRRQQKCLSRIKYHERLADLASVRGAELKEKE